MRTFLSVAILLVLVGVGGVYYVKYYHTQGTSSFRTAQIELGDMLPTIGATGTLEPEQVVDIGSQVNGLVTDLKVDYGSNVNAGTVLATIDQTVYQAVVDQNLAALNRAKADLGQMKAMLAKSEADLKRDNELLKKGAIALSDYDAAVATHEVAKANVGVDEAAIKQAEAALRQSSINLGYCDIKSPVKGTIIDRRVNVGQTVVSNLSASSMFLLAKDLSRIQVWASVNEADIGRIQPGVKVHFTVDAYPNETFYGEVLQVRLNATMTQNVVTYTVVVTTENKDMKLLPYMTANLLFEIDRHENVLKVPNAALRWKPRPQQIAPDVRAETLLAMNGGGKSKRGDKKRDEGKDSAQAPAADTPQKQQPAQGTKAVAAGEAPADQGPSLAASAGTATGSTPEDWKARSEKHARKDGKTAVAAAPQAAKAAGGRQPPGQPISAQTAKKLKEHFDSARLWVVDGNFVRPILVKIIATDGTTTEVRGKGDELSEGLEVVVGESVASDSDNDTTNPFMPRMFRGNSSSKNSSSK